VHSDQTKTLEAYLLSNIDTMSGPLYERQAQSSESRAPLTLVTTLEVDDIPTLELLVNYNDSTMKKVTVFTYDLESLEQVLYCFYEFLEAVRKLRLEFYQDTLRGHARMA
jgi:hypothetical protein